MLSEEELLLAIVRQRLADGDRIDRETDQAVQAKRQQRKREIAEQVVQEVQGPATLVDELLRHLAGM